MDYMTITEASTKWNISTRRIQTLCSQGRIPGAERLGYCWVLPKDAVKPADARIKSGKYIGYSMKYNKAVKKKTGSNRPV
ncbi:MAG: helix-turn-helix domain-containing protein [Clostridiales bacterium]|nr:helix-turn-helix domain-containing protein [Clostridiales bacterium]